jgi:hypothetical protein
LFFLSYKIDNELPLPTIAKPLIGSTLNRAVKTGGEMTDSSASNQSYLISQSNTGTDFDDTQNDYDDDDDDEDEVDNENDLEVNVHESSRHSNNLVDYDSYNAEDSDTNHTESAQRYFFARRRFMTTKCSPENAAEQAAAAIKETVITLPTSSVGHVDAKTRSRLVGLKHSFATLTSGQVKKKKTKKPKLFVLNKTAKNDMSNKILSDIDIELEDDLIFDDDDDSLSSTGLCGTRYSNTTPIGYSKTTSGLSTAAANRNVEPSSQVVPNESATVTLLNESIRHTQSSLLNSNSTLTNLDESGINQPKSKMLPTSCSLQMSVLVSAAAAATTEKSSASSVNNNEQQQRQLYKQSLSSLNKEKAKLNPSLVNSSSMSDIEPDENILKNLLVKNRQK